MLVNCFSGSRVVICRCVSCDGGMFFFFEYVDVMCLKRLVFDIYFNMVFLCCWGFVIKLKEYFFFLGSLRFGFKLKFGVFFCRMWYIFFKINYNFVWIVIFVFDFFGFSGDVIGIVF